MTHKIALAQCSSSISIEENLEKADIYMSKARQQEAFLIVFPEYFMMAYHAPAYVKESQTLDGPFVSRMKELARNYQIWTLFAMNESAGDAHADKCYNTLVLLDSNGQLKGFYRKNHLFDAFHWKESDLTLPGTEGFTPIDTPAGKLGLGTCFDLRFPELARRQAQLGAQLILYPAAWVHGEGKDIQWKTLLAARAIENGMYAIGCSQYTPDTYMGKSFASDPFGKVLAEGGFREELLFVSVDCAQSDYARKLIPSLPSELL